MPISDTETSYGPSAEGEGTIRVPGAPVCVSNAAGTATFNFDDNGNGDTVTYAIYVTVDATPRGYLAADGTDNGASEIWQTLAVWGDVTMTGLTDFVAYNTKVKAKSDAGVESAFSAATALNSLPDIDYGPESANLEREVTGGNTKIDETLGIVPSGDSVLATEASQTEVTEYYGELLFTYTLKNNSATASRIAIEFSEDYDPDNPEIATWATATAGTAGDGLTALTTSAAGVEHEVSWDSYTDAGTSELKTGVYFRITPYDASPSGGDAGETVISSVFGVNNRPAIMTWTNADGFVFDKDSTPIFRAIMSSLRGGTVGFPELTIYENDGTTEVQSCKSVESIAGWEYESEPDTWVAMTVAGIPSSEIDGINRVRFTVQTVLDAAEYIVKGRMGEYRNLS